MTRDRRQVLRWAASAGAAYWLPANAWNQARLGQQTLLGPRDFAIGPAQKFWNDGWDGYTAARGRLTRAPQQPGVANAVVLGGDVHENWVAMCWPTKPNPTASKWAWSFAVPASPPAQAKWIPARRSCKRTRTLCLPMRSTGAMDWPISRPAHCRLV